MVTWALGPHWVTGESRRVLGTRCVTPLFLLLPSENRAGCSGREPLAAMAYFNHLIIKDLILSPSLPGCDCVWSFQHKASRRPPEGRAAVPSGGPLSMGSCWRRPRDTAPVNSLSMGNKAS